ncbi:MAG: twin-arginine translocase subunit TatC [Thermaceae bacterium]
MKEAPLVEHLEELRTRLLWSILAWAVATGVAWTFRVGLLNWLKHPLDLAAKQNGIQVNLIVLDITEPFLVSLKVAAFGGLVLALPFIVYQIWAFIAPGLYEHERRLAVPFLLGAGFSFALGALFAYYGFMPFAIPFLLGFLGDVVTPQISIGRYMGQVLMMMTVMGLVFEMPVVSYLLARLGILSSRFLAQNWRIAVVLLLTLAAVITPTVDVVSLSIVTLPLLLLYWVSFLVVRFVERRRNAPSPSES